MKSFSSASASDGRFASAEASCSRSFWKKEGGWIATMRWKKMIGGGEREPLRSAPSEPAIASLTFPPFLSSSSARCRSSLGFSSSSTSISLFSHCLCFCLNCSIFEHEIQIARDGGGLGGMRTTLENDFIFRSCGFVPSDGDQWIPNCGFLRWVVCVAYYGSFSSFSGRKSWCAF
ncbi:hypothetical protein SLA2020_389080 [Shorea laevis]